MNEGEWRKFVEELRTKDIANLEFLVNFAFYREDLMPDIPWLVTVEINKEITLASYWWSNNDNKRHFYPIVGPNCPEAECISPTEWEVLFLGSLKQLKESGLASQMESLPSDGDEAILAILRTKDSLHGFDRRT